KEVAKSIPTEKDPAKKQVLIAEGKDLKGRVAKFEQELKQIEIDLHAVVMQVPNMTHPDAPVSRDPAGNKVLRRVGEPRKVDFKPKDHVALAEALDLVDFEAGSQVAGQKFYFLNNDAVLRELTLVQYAMQNPIAAG